MKKDMSHVLVLSYIDGTLVRKPIALSHAIFCHENGLMDLGEEIRLWKTDVKRDGYITILAEEYRSQLVGRTKADVKVLEFIEKYLKTMKLVSEGKVNRVLVYSKDRLTRFGFNYLDFFFSAHGTTIMLFEDVENKTGMQELVDDMMNLIASFSGKFYGLRSAKKRAARAVLDEVSSNE